jgi:hypothetical protein
MNIPKEVISWREGDEITLEHRRILSAFMAEFYNLSKEKAETELQKYNELSDYEIAEYLAIMIAMETKMSLDEFLLAFPTISQDSKNIAVQMFIKMKFPKNIN